MKTSFGQVGHNEREYLKKCSIDQSVENILPQNNEIATESPSQTCR